MKNKINILFCYKFFNKKSLVFCHTFHQQPLFKKKKDNVSPKENKLGLKKEK